MKFINPYNLFQGAFTPSFILRRTELSQGAKNLYGRLNQFAGRNGEAFPSIDRLAYEIGVKRRQIFNYLKELTDHKLIHIQRRGHRKTSVYKFLEHPWMSASVDNFDTEDDKGCKDVHVRGADMCTLDVQDLAPRINQLKINNKTILSGKPDTACLKNKQSKNRTDQLDEFQREIVEDTIEIEKIKEWPVVKQAIFVLAFLNVRAKRRFKATEANLSCIRARFKEGYTDKDFRQVIANRVMAWGADEKMWEYLRPKTLFNATNFSSYHGNLGSNVMPLRQGVR